jgi:hypothetical protein
MKNSPLLKKSYYLIIVFLFSLFTFKSYSMVNVVFKAVEHNYEILHVSSGEGTETVKIYSFEKNKAKGIQQGKLNALRAIIFNGIPNADFQKPMISEAGAEEKYKSYFHEFFKDGGKYLKFVTLTSNNIEVIEGLGKLKVGIVVTIQKDNLRKELEASNIIKALNNGF